MVSSIAMKHLQFKANKMKRKERKERKKEEKI